MSGGREVAVAAIDSNYDGRARTGSPDRTSTALVIQLAVVSLELAGAQYLLPRVLARFRKRYPAIEVTFDITVSGMIEPKVLASEIDFGLASYEPRDPRLVAQAFMTDELVAIVPRDHKLAHRRHITPQELTEDMFIVAAPAPGTRTLLEERLRD